MAGYELVCRYWLGQWIQADQPPRQRGQGLIGEGFFPVVLEFIQHHICNWYCRDRRIRIALKY
jgi:hypothetical protein